MVENKVNQILADVSQNGNLALQVRNIGLFQTNIGCQIFADNNENKTDSRVAAINSLTVEYSPFELLRGKIKNINIENADLLTEYQNGVFSMPALDVIMKTFIQQQNNTEKSATTVPEDLNRLIPIRTEQINISGNLVLNVENDIVFIHYQAMLKPDSES